ncbi:PASTA domain-containing protein [Vagococcus salmoninarum]|uniref:PASTA domain-containing protein n=2 Tax=Vagococcus salmoninarum TaxID=2739 RepID=A0A429ZTY5_9ENTE|nr:PASTA domain-containing protein [Vagococcus salmoninarum]MBE9388875.1 PASTA domain-containing protein [Vagococcus salmoninarum]RST97196.1 hypothetical protein CBF35_02795 [Vagococcus salmoninarum]
MSDFLSNFDQSNYKKTLSEKKGKKTEGTTQTEETSASRKKRSQVKKSTEEVKVEVADVNEGATNEANLEAPLVDSSDGGIEDQAFIKPEDLLLEEVSEPKAPSNEEETVIDPTYKKRQQRKIIIASTLGVLAALLLFWVYYAMSHVKMPDFVGKTTVEAREWASENNVTIDLKQEYDFDKDVNVIVKQNAKAGKQVKKKSTVKLTSSLGPDPEEVIPLPDFAKMTKQTADEWVEEHKAENLSVLEEYNDKIKKGDFIKQEITNKEVKAETYKREDKAIIYFSKGKEVFEKDVEVPDFAKKAKSDVETWVKTNEIKMTYKEIDSDTIEEGGVVSQSIPKGTKVAKRDSMSVEISIGKAVTIPNFAEKNPETASTVDGLVVTVKTVFNSEIPYGQLISQSEEAGTKVKIKEPKPITVVYSAGKPYLRSYFGQLEGDLDKLFFDDYRSKGANISYTTYYVDSAETRGTVVDMGAYNQFVAMDYVVSIAISNGSKAGKPTDSPRPESGGDKEVPEETPEEDSGE